MKKKVWIILSAIVLLLALLFIPLPDGVAQDGGTRVYTSLTYKIVQWNRLTTDGSYQKACIYWGSAREKSLDELWAMESEKLEHSFLATVIQITSNSVIVVPIEGQPELHSADKLSFSIPEDIGAQVNSIVKITYTGAVAETYPAQINAVKWEIATDLRTMEYKEKWLLADELSIEQYDPESSFDLVITQIYADCFFANYVIPMPYTVKVDYALSDEWCVGDQIFVAYSSLSIDSENYRMQCTPIRVEASTFVPDPEVAYKPVIYLYPEAQTAVSVHLALNGSLTCTYPAYQHGWQVTAAPDGTLTGANGQTYNYLYWEGQIAAKWDMTKGFCIKGADTAAFLEDALAKLGLTRREANEFIVYWLPLMQENPYNVISFQTVAYTDAAKPAITPQPDTLIRVFMTYKPSNTFVQITPQVLTAPERVGFTAVEWGGTQAN